METTNQKEDEVFKLYDDKSKDPIILKGGAPRCRNRYPLEVLARILELRYVQRLPPHEAWSIALTEYNQTAQEPLQLPRSCTQEGTPAQMCWQVRQRFLKVLNDPLHPEHERCKSLAQKHNLILVDDN